MVKIQKIKKCTSRKEITGNFQTLKFTVTVSSVFWRRGGSGDG